MFGFSSCDIIVNLQKSCFRREKQMKARLKQTTNRREKIETERKRRIKKKVLEIMGEEGTNKKKMDHLDDKEGQNTKIKRNNNAIIF